MNSISMILCVYIQHTLIFHIPSMGLNTSLLGKISQRYEGSYPAWWNLFFPQKNSTRLGWFQLVTCGPIPARGKWRFKKLGIPTPTKYCHVIHQWWRATASLKLRGSSPSFKHMFESFHLKIWADVRCPFLTHKTTWSLTKLAPEKSIIPKGKYSSSLPTSSNHYFFRAFSC